MANPNFPANLDIHPSVPIVRNGAHTDDTNFGSDAQAQAIRQYGIAGKVWEAAYTFISYVSSGDHLEFDPPFLDASRPSNMLELGSGTGIVAASIAKLLSPGRDRIIATDLPEVCPLLELNLSEHDTVLVKPLSWGNSEEAFDLSSSLFAKEKASGYKGPLTHIICSDLVYFPDLLAPLLRSLLHITAPPFVEDAGPSVFISYKIRSLTKETAFWSAFGLWFDFRPVLQRERGSRRWQRFGNDFQSDTMFLFIAHRRPNSHSWRIPDNDEELLAGLGANGINTRKSDDTFENILMLSIENDD